MTKVKEFVNDCLGTALDLKLMLKFGDCIVQHNTSESSLHDELVYYFKPFLTDDTDEPEIIVNSFESPEPDLGLKYRVKKPDPGKTKIKEEFFDSEDGLRVVRKRLTGMIFIFGGDINIAVGSCTENTNQVINFINNRLIERNLNRGAVLLHAAGVILDGKGVAIAGFSGMGKSTLALHLLSEGLDFVSNDRITLHRSKGKPIIIGVAKLPRINPGTALNNPDLVTVLPKSRAKALKNMATSELWALEEKYDVFIDKCFQDSSFVLSAPIKVLFVLNWKLSKEPMKIREVDLEKDTSLFPAFMKSTGLFYHSSDESRLSDPSQDDYCKSLKGCKVYELSGGADFKSATAECVKIVRGMER